VKSSVPQISREAWRRFQKECANDVAKSILNENTERDIILDYHAAFIESNPRLAHLCEAHARALGLTNDPKALRAANVASMADVARLISHELELRNYGTTEAKPETPRFLPIVSEQIARNVTDESNMLLTGGNLAAWVDAELTHWQRENPQLFRLVVSLLNGLHAACNEEVYPYLCYAVLAPLRALRKQQGANTNIRSSATTS
jgi:hypothetical protein